MSGTSADGVTAVLVELGARSARVLRERTFPYPPALKKRVLAGPALPVPELSRLNFELGELFASAALAVSRGARPAVIGSHGQTMWHGRRMTPRNTLQIAEPAVIAERTGVTTVADFRVRDIASGGEGAPLVPAFDLFLYGSGPLKAVLNIGGIANVSLVGGGRLHSAFDTGPGNALMDEAVRRATGGRREYDAAGRLAASGRADPALLRRALREPYFLRLPPKSLDRTDFGPVFLTRAFPRATKRRLPDLLATLAELTAVSIWLDVLENAPGPVSELLVSGGGALNRHLMRRLEALFAPVPVRTTAARGMPVMAKEAACFAWLAARALQGRPNNAPAATGAAGPRVLGKIVPA
jgi:anhydro-N-acetylmuramic acid kinase